MQPQLTKEEIREARLRAMAGRPGSASSVSSNTNVAKESKESTSELSSSSSSSTNIVTMGHSQFESLLNLVYRGGVATDEDMLRWNSEGFRFCPDPIFGLQQHLGGPCGVLAVIEAEVLRRLYFSETGDCIRHDLASVTAALVEDALLSALLEVFVRVAPKGNPRFSIVFLESFQNLELPIGLWNVNNVKIVSFSSLAALKTGIIDYISQFKSPAGCLLFLLSIILTKGCEEIKGDMDDPTATLIGQFGHCNQELINLLLTGYAVSNVFDGEMELGDSGMKVKGIKKRSLIGYLTHLEALRYCQVGSYYKNPVFPIWVVGSSSHFTVLFSLEKEVNEESVSEKLFTMLQRCFKSIDTDECGYIPSSKLYDALAMIGSNPEYDAHPIFEVIYDSTELARLRGHLQMEGEIILWTTFWVNVSKLMSGQTLDDLIQCDNVMDVDNKNNNNSENPEITSGKRKRSDSEIAREIQQQLDENPNFDLAQFLEQQEQERQLQLLEEQEMKQQKQQQQQQQTQTRLRSDSEIARELQAQWDNEEFGGPSNQQNNSNNNLMTPPASTSQPNPSIQQRQETVNKGSPRALSDSVAGEDAPANTLYHFNGLQGVDRHPLTTLTLRRRVTADAIGKIVALDHTEQASFGGSFICPIEEVLRTRWPGCRVSWSSPQAPRID